MVKYCCRLIKGYFVSRVRILPVCTTNSSSVGRAVCPLPAFSYPRIFFIAYIAGRFPGIWGIALSVRTNALRIVVRLERAKSLSIVHRPMDSRMASPSEFSHDAIPCKRSRGGAPVLEILPFQGVHHELCIAARPARAKSLSIGHRRMNSRMASPNGTRPWHRPTNSRMASSHQLAHGIALRDSCMASPYELSKKNYPLFTSLAHASFSVTVRLKIRWSVVLSVSTQK